MVSKRTPFARKFVAPLRYTTQFSLDVAAGGVPDVRNICLTGLYDPEPTSGIKHQPMGFDEIMGTGVSNGLYDHYNVIGVKWKLTAINITNNAAHTCYIGTLVSDDTKTTYIQGMNIEGISENPEIRTAVVTPRDATRNIRTLSGRINPNKFLGKSKGILNDDRLKGSQGANPTENVWLNVFVAPFAKGTDTTQMEFLLEMEYLTVFTEPRTIAQS